MDCFVATLLAMTGRERVRNDWKGWGNGEKGWGMTGLRIDRWGSSTALRSAKNDKGDGYIFWRNFLLK